MGTFNTLVKFGGSNLFMGFVQHSISHNQDLKFADF